MPKTLKLLLIVFVALFIGIWLYIKYDERVFLRYGVLKLAKYPESMKMLEYKTEGASDFHAEYNITIDSTDFSKLLAGRRYKKENAHNATILDIPYNEPHDFNPKYRYCSGIIGNGITVIYVNSDNTKVFIDYWVN